MDFKAELNEAIKAFREARLDRKSETELISMIRIFRQWQTSQFAGEAPQAIEAVEKELVRRQRDKHQEAAKELHQAAMTQGKTHHGETIKEIGEVKTAVVRLAGARWIDWAILVATAIAAIAGVILLFR